jgi:alpha-1,2-mannosyltransferase
MRNRLLAAAALVVFLLLAYYATSYVNETDTRDLQIYIDSARRLTRGESLYDVRYTFPERASDFELQYLYPPALAALLAPISFLDQAAIIFAWQSGLVLAVGLAAWMLSQLLSRCSAASTRATSFPVVLILLALWPPTLDGILWGQVNAYILALFVAAAYLTSRGSERTAGLALGVAVAIKATPAILALPFLAQRRWRSLGWTVIGVLLSHLPLLLYPNGLRTIPEFLRTTAEIASGHVVNDPYYDYSLRRVVTFFVEAPASLFSGLSLALILGYGAILMQAQRPDAAAEKRRLLCALQIFLGIPIMVVASPLVWFHHLIWLFPPVAAVMLCSANRPLSLAGRAIYLALAPLLYVHVFIRYWVQAGEGLVKALPVILSGLICCLLACFVRVESSVLDSEPTNRN